MLSIKEYFKSVKAEIVTFWKDKSYWNKARYADDSWVDKCWFGDLESELSAILDEIYSAVIPNETSSSQDKYPVSYPAWVLHTKEAKRSKSTMKCLPNIAFELYCLLPDSEKVRAILPVLIWAYLIKCRYVGEELYAYKLDDCSGEKAKNDGSCKMRESVFKLLTPRSWLYTCTKMNLTDIVPAEKRIRNKYYEVRLFVALLNIFSEICNPYLSAIVFNYYTEYLTVCFLPEMLEKVNFLGSNLPTAEDCEYYSNKTLNVLNSYYYFRKMHNVNDVCLPDEHIIRFCVAMRAYLCVRDYKNDIYNFEELCKVKDSGVLNTIYCNIFLRYLEENPHAFPKSPTDNGGDDD